MRDWLAVKLLREVLLLVRDEVLGLCLTATLRLVIWAAPLMGRRKARRVATAAVDSYARMTRFEN